MVGAGIYRTVNSLPKEVVENASEVVENYLEVVEKGSEVVENEPKVVEKPSEVVEITKRKNCSASVL